MRLSWFNNIVEYDDRILLYNALSDHYLLISKQLNELLAAAKINGDAAEIAEVHPLFYKELEGKGFVVADELDELARVKNIREQVDLLDDELFQLVINPTMNCNFKCWYCYESHEKNSKMSADTVDRVKAFIKQVISTNKNLKKFVLSWFGGEPLLYYESVILPLSVYAKELLDEHQIQLLCNYTTNGFLIREAMLPDFHRFNVVGFQITLDGNRDLHNAVRFVNTKRGSYDDIMQNIVMLCRNELTVSLRINYTKTNIDVLEDILQDLNPLEPEVRKYLRVSFHKVWQEQDEGLTVKIRKLVRIFREQGHYAFFGETPDNVRDSCYADKKNHATINYNGNVYKCTARNFSGDSKEGTLLLNGSIDWNEKLDKRLDIKFKNKPCLRCSILPICNGGCSQVALENEGKDYCVYDFDESKKKEVILNKFLQRYV